MSDKITIICHDWIPNKPQASAVPGTTNLKHLTLWNVMHSQKYHPILIWSFRYITPLEKRYFDTPDQLYVTIKKPYNRPPDYKVSFFCEATY